MRFDDRLRICYNPGMTLRGDNMKGSGKLVYDTLDMCNKSRAPRDFWTLPWAEEHHGAGARPENVRKVYEVWDKVTG